ncbi:MAG: hypothetical protein NPIRA04_32410 [Nitrospirales bacterium]|nr:MAG: hypothetical protein NPIRA04_32410 [Nitrospirales bacterium]
MGISINDGDLNGDFIELMKMANYRLTSIASYPIIMPLYMGKL